MKKIFIDGSAGTTGLRIYERLGKREDVTLLTLSDEDRKKPECRRAMLNEADVAFLCLPDEAAIESVSMIENESTVVIKLGINVTVSVSALKIGTLDKNAFP